MFHTLKDFFKEVSMLSGKAQKKHEDEVEVQRLEFSKENPSLTEKRNSAISYLGEKWIIKQKHYPRRSENFVLGKLK